MTGRPASFPLVKLAVHAPRQVSHPLGDDEARNRLRDRLTVKERVALGADMCVSLHPARPGPGARTITSGHQYDVHGATETGPWRYRNASASGYVGFEFEPAPEARYLELPGLRANKDIHIYWCDEKRRWRPGQVVRWLKSPNNEGEAVIDLDRLIHLSVKPLSRIVIAFIGPDGEFTLEGPPRLLR